MGNLGMPKHSADLADITAVLDVYNKAGSWLDNETFIKSMKTKLGSNLEPQAYTKKTQIPSYFGFTEWENSESNQSKRRITDSGKRFYSGLVAGDESVIFGEIIESLSTRTFGRNVCGVDSDSDLEPPNIFIKAALAL